MDPTERPLPSTDSLPDQTDTLLEAVFTRYIRSGTAETGSEPGRLVVEMARHAGSKHKDSFDEFYAILGGGGLTTANASAVSEEFVASCIGGGGGGRCNWGRVVTALAFSRLVAGKLLADGKDGESLDDYSASVGKALARFVREWRSREGQDLDLQTPSAGVSSSKRWTAEAFVTCFGAFVKVGAFAVNYANEAIR